MRCFHWTKVQWRVPRRASDNGSCPGRGPRDEGDVMKPLQQLLPVMIVAAVAAVGGYTFGGTRASPPGLGPATRLRASHVVPATRTTWLARTAVVPVPLLDATCAPSLAPPRPHQPGPGIATTSITRPARTRAATRCRPCTLPVMAAGNCVVPRAGRVGLLRDVARSAPHSRSRADRAE